MNSLKPYIQLDNITKVYDSIIDLEGSTNFIRKMVGKVPICSPSKNKALKDISLRIEDGERIGILGENGAGKSTLLSILAGVSKETTGTVEIKGKVHAVLTLGLGIREDLTGRENLYLEGEIQGKSRQEIGEIIDEMIEYSELGEFIDKPVRIYSSGMKSKLAFTSLIFIQPEILLIDEALSVGDIWFARKATDTIKKICNSGRIVIIVSHGLESLIEMCTRCIWLEKGKIVLDDTPDKVVAAYREFIRKRNDDKACNRAFNSKKDKPNILDEDIGEGRFRFKMYGDDLLLRESSVISEGAHVKLDIEIARSNDAKVESILFTLERMDGVVVTQNSCPTTDLNKLNTNTIFISIDCGKIRVRPGYYKSIVKIQNTDIKVTEWSMIFEVTSTNTVSGGNPMFRWPVTYFTRDQISLLETS